MKVYILRSDGVVQRYHRKNFEGLVKVGKVGDRVLWTTVENYDVMKEKERREYEEERREIERSYQEKRVEVEPYKVVKAKKFVYRVHVRLSYKSTKGKGLRRYEMSFDVVTERVISEEDVPELLFEQAEDWVANVPWDEVDVVGIETVGVEE